MSRLYRIKLYNIELFRQHMWIAVAYLPSGHLGHAPLSKISGPLKPCPPLVFGNCYFKSELLAAGRTFDVLSQISLWFSHLLLPFIAFYCHCKFKVTMMLQCLRYVIYLFYVMYSRKYILTWLHSTDRCCLVNDILILYIGLISLTLLNFICWNG